MDIDSYKHLLRYAKREHDRKLEQLAEFGRRFEQNPGNAFYWGDEALSASVAEPMWRFIVATVWGALEGQAPGLLAMEALRDKMLKEAMRTPEQSSSPMASRVKILTQQIAIEIYKELTLWDAGRAFVPAAKDTGGIEGAV